MFSKQRIQQVLSLFLTLVLFLGVYVPASGQEPVPGKDLPVPVGETDVSALKTPANSRDVLPLDFRATAAVEDGGEPETERYIVQFEDPPATRYDGGIEGLGPVSAAATNAAKLDASGDPAEAYVEYLKAEQATFTARFERTTGRTAQVDYQYFLALNGMAIHLTKAEAHTIARMPGVKSVQPDWVEYAQTDAGPAFMGATDIWTGSGTGGKPGTKGEGIVVGIVDTGINMDHPSFADVGGDGHDHVNPRGKFYGWCDSAHPDYDPTLVCNDKLIGVWSGDEDSPEDADGHGTHTASTTAGNFINNATVNAPTTSVTVPLISGVAPHANIIAYNIEGAPGTGSASGAVIIAATEQAIQDQVDVINYSFGGGGADPWASAEHWFNVRAAGIFVATSAGNAGSAPDTIGSPANAPWVMTVGASSHDRKFSNVLMNLSGGTTPPADIEGEGITSGYGPAPIVYAGTVDPNNVGCDVPYTPGTFSGEIVVCDYNSGPQYGGRVNKSINLANGGAGGFILINRVDWGAALMVDSYAVPGMGIPYDKGEELKTWLASGSGQMASIRGVANETARGDIMAGFSSRGPNGPAPDIVKPDVTAPGRRILAAVATTNSADPAEYDVYQGTSMSSPHAAGAAALIRGIHPDWTPAQVQSALMTTALNSGILKEDVATAADPFDMGAGRVDLAQAGVAGLLLDVSTAAFEAANPADGGVPSTLNLPSMGQDQCVGTCSWTRTVENALATAGSWTASMSADAGMNISVSPSSFSLNSGETQEVVVTADVNGAPEGEWLFGHIFLTEDGAQAPTTHMPVAAAFSAGSVPMSVDITTRRNAGSQLATDLRAIEITNLTTTIHGLAKGDITEERLVSDPTNGDPYDGGFDPLVDGTFFVNVDIPAGTMNFIAETIFSESPDMDLFVGAGATPSLADELCRSTSGSAIEYCELASPAAGTYWVLVQNWNSGNGAALPGELITLVTAVVPESNSGNMRVEGPSSVPANTSFDVRVFWDTPTMAAGDRWYGSFDLGSDPANPGNIGNIPVLIQRVEDDVTKSVNPDTAIAGDTLTYEIVVQPNVTPEDLAYTITDAIPDGLTYVDGSATATSGIVDVTGDTLTWTGDMAVPELEYAMSTSASDPLCDTGFGGYVNLEAFGILTQPGISGDTAGFTAFSTGDLFSYYGNEYAGMSFTDDGFAIFDLGSNYGGAPWNAQAIPNADQPNNVLPIYWHDFEIFYDGPMNHGVSLATAGANVAIVEYDDIQFFGGSAPVMDFEIVMTRAVNNAPGAYEIVYAYDNINALPAPATIGLENVDGTAATALVNQGNANGVVSNGFMVCFDQVGAADPVVISYDVTVDADAHHVLTNNVVHNTDNPGSMEANTSADVEIPNVPPVCTAALAEPDMLWPANHNFVPIEVLGVTDSDGDSITITIDSIFQDEPVSGNGSGNTSPDGRGVGASTAEVRAERVGGGNGRYYHIFFTADDGYGGSCSAEVLVGVPKNQGKKGAPVDDGALYDSTNMGATAVGDASESAAANPDSLPDEPEHIFLPVILQ